MKCYQIKVMLLEKGDYVRVYRGLARVRKDEVFTNKERMVEVEMLDDNSLIVEGDIINVDRDIVLYNTDYKYSMEVMKYVAAEYNIKLVQVVKGDKYCVADGEESYINRSFIIGNDEIQLGIYESDELRCASFFHELGHTMVTDDFAQVVEGMWHIEVMAWRIGFNTAKGYDILFSDSTTKWAEEQIATYK